MKKNRTQATDNQWTTLVYMAADNNLTEECVYSLKELHRVGTVPGVHAAALYDSSAQNVPTRVYTFKQKSAGSKESDNDGRLEDIGKVFSVRIPKKDGKGFTRTHSAADSRMLEEFVRAGISKNPALNYLLILSGHGQGAIGDFLKGDDPPQSLSIPDFASALERAMKGKGPISVLGMDACLMGMAEVCYELRNTVRFMVSAEGFEINSGWPYQRIMESLNEAVSTKGIQPEELARMILERYMSYYRDYVIAGVSVDQAVADLSKAETLATAVKNLATVLKRGVVNSQIQNAIVLAHWKAQTYMDDKYVDLWDFCDQLEAGLAGIDAQIASRMASKKLNADVKDACQAAKAAVERLIIVSSYSGAAFQHSHGISVYFPWRGNPDEMAAYKNLAFHKQTLWGDFLSLYVNETRRSVRNAGLHKPGAAIWVAPAQNAMAAHRSAAPWFRGEGYKTGSMKNPPACFFPADSDRSKR